jgi:3-hydroxyacyl-CoA dehydrogenase (EC 1.1.1.35)
MMRNVGVIGCGIMGAGIVQLALQSGYNVIVREMNQDFLNKGINKINKGLGKLCEKGVLKNEEKEELSKRLKGTLSFDDLKECDIVIEAVFEDIKVKTEVFMSLDPICRKETIFASNTSSLPITQMAARTVRKERFIGLHFFNPVSVMPLVEVIKTIVTDNDTVQAAMGFIASLGKHPILAKDNAGFIVNLLLTPYLLDAIRAVGEGVASTEDIDGGMKLGCNHPMGPLMLADYIGLDVLRNAANILFEEYREKRYAPPPLLVKMVAMGYLGNKSGRGFYDWSDQRNPKVLNLGG